EAPKVGDPLRVWRKLDVDGTTYIARNKQSVAVDLRKPEGRVSLLAIKSDVIIENFKPGTLEKWGLGPEALHRYNPSLIFTCVSGYGQTGPWVPRPGYASVCEAETGSRYIHGFPDPENGGLSGPPVRPDMGSVAGLQAASGIVSFLAIRVRILQYSSYAIQGHMLSIAVRSTSRIVPEYDRKGKVRVVDRFVSHSSVTGIAPANDYPCVPDLEAPTVPSFIVIGANGDSIYNRLMQVVECPDLTGPAVALRDLSKKIEVDASGETLD
ncbi:CoA-transferase family III domain-containing protein, partial [Lentinula raphanica]